MRYYCVFILGLLWAVGVKGQTLWNKTYVEDRPAMAFSSVAWENDTFRVIGVTVNKTPAYKQQFLAVSLDLNGDIASYSASPDTSTMTTSVFSNTLILANDGRFAFAGHGSDTAAHLVFGFWDQLHDTVAIYRYYTGKPFSFQGTALLQYDDSTFFVAGAYNKQGVTNTDVVLVKIDSYGNRLWEKTYDAQKQDFAESIIRLKNGNLLLGAFKSDLNQVNNKSSTWLIEVDTGGTIIRQWFDSSDSTFAAFGLRQTQDGGFIYAAQKKFSQENGLSIPYTATIVKLDSSFGKQWVFNGGYRGIYTGLSDIEILQDGSYVACGQYPIYASDTVRHGWIVKLDTLGHVVWNKVFRGFDKSQTFHFLNDIDVLPDGGFIAVGQAQDASQTPSQYGWILRLDSNGCEIENCILSLNPSPKERDLNSQIQVFPNPASNVVQVSLGNEFVGGSLKLYSTTGALVKEVAVEAPETIINASTLAKGLYFVTAEKDGVVGKGKLVVE